MLVYAAADCIVALGSSWTRPSAVPDGVGHRPFNAERRSSVTMAGWKKRATLVSSTSLDTCFSEPVSRAMASFAYRTNSQ